MSSHRYIAQEFPLLAGSKCSVYSVPKHPILRTEHQVGNTVAQSCVLVYTIVSQSSGLWEGVGGGPDGPIILKLHGVEEVQEIIACKSLKRKHCCICDIASLLRWR